MGFDSRFSRYGFQKIIQQEAEFIQNIGVYYIPHLIFDFLMQQMLDSRSLKRLTEVQEIYCGDTYFLEISSATDIIIHCPVRGI